MIIFSLLHFTSSICISGFAALCWTLGDRGAKGALFRITADGTASSSDIGDSPVIPLVCTYMYLYGLVCQTRLGSKVNSIIEGSCTDIAPAAFVGYAMMRTVN